MKLEIRMQVNEPTNKNVVWYNPITKIIKFPSAYGWVESKHDDLSNYATKTDLNNVSTAVQNINNELININGDISTLDNKTDDIQDQILLSYPIKGSSTVVEINALQEKETGDAYHVTDNGTIDPGGVVVVAGDNVIWNGANWTKLSGTYNPETSIVTEDVFMRKVNPVGSGSISLNRKEGTVVGNESTTLGYNNEASQMQAYAEGHDTASVGWATHAEGARTVAGDKDKAYHATEGAHAEGIYSEAKGKASHAEGYGTKAYADYSHAEGYQSAVAPAAAYSHAEGYGTNASAQMQNVRGRYNIKDTQGVYLDIVGNGTSSNARRNCYTLDWYGNAWFSGDVTCNDDNTEIKMSDLNKRPRISAILSLNPGEQTALYNDGSFGTFSMTVTPGSGSCTFNVSWTNATSNFFYISKANVTSQGSETTTSFSFTSNLYSTTILLITF